MKRKKIIFYIITAILTLVIFGVNYWQEMRLPLLNSRSFASTNEFDIVVVGAEPEGISAAISAARSGAHVLLVDHREKIGGLLTYGMLNTLDMSYGIRHRLLTKGIFYEFFKQVEGSSFDVKNAERVLDAMLAGEPNITFWGKTSFIKPYKSNNNEILGVELFKDGKHHTIFAKRFIDATTDANVAAKAGVPYMTGGADRGYPDKFMAATLVFGFEGVNWAKIRTILQRDGDPLTGADLFSAWGFLDIMKRYKPLSPRINMRGLNMGRQKDGTVLINAMQIFHVNGTDYASKINAINIAKKELPRISNYIRAQVPGFEHAKLSIVAPELYVRESRHIIGEYRLTINDVLENRDFWDTIAIGSYPVDIQAMDRNNYGVITGKPVQFGIPFRCLVPLEVENLLVVGRSASYWSVPMGSARVVPVGMCEGEAAGVAAAYSIWKNVSFRNMSKDHQAISDVKDILTQRGAYLQKFNIFNPNTLHWSYPSVRILLPTGSIASKYSNNFHFDEQISEKSFFVMSRGMMRVLKDQKYIINLEKKYEKTASEEPITADKACYYLLLINGYEKEVQQKQNHIALAKKKGLIPPLVVAKGFGMGKVTYAHTYELLAHTYMKGLKNTSNIYAPAPDKVLTTH